MRGECSIGWMGWARSGEVWVGDGGAGEGRGGLGEGGKEERYRLRGTQDWTGLGYGVMGVGMGEG